MENFENKLLRSYVGYLGEREESQKVTIYKILANANMLTFYFTTILMLISLIWDSIHQQFTLGTFLLLAVQQFNSYYILFKFRKYKVQQTKFDDKEAYILAVKTLKLKGFWIGLDWGVSMFITMTFIFPTLWHDPIRVTIWNVLIWLTAGFFFGFTMYLVSKNQLKLVTNDSD
ncbi:DUF3278 domain-containing protein [Enterococcus sp. MJM12]|uniref:DUF3278 domain-containing protein n=1 Tax=Candidatus Enterococcus myersii TaxID=2815322 RepID=A0ABS3H8D7_9ENTE|nr:DUF3278 domain-containing protein [Enterococcus sp. MJM12]MBO0449175.1 DUF3278 domain-containing protein [Enterococcus sp. MJM12]